MVYLVPNPGSFHFAPLTHLQVDIVWFSFCRHLVRTWCLDFSDVHSTGLKELAQLDSMVFLGKLSKPLLRFGHGEVLIHHRHLTVISICLVLMKDGIFIQWSRYTFSYVYGNWEVRVRNALSSVGGRTYGFILLLKFDV